MTHESRSPRGPLLLLRLCLLLEGLLRRGDREAHVLLQPLLVEEDREGRQLGYALVRLQLLFLEGPVDGSHSAAR